jgi:hypothetical protein
VFTDAALRFVGNAAFPRLAYRLRWETRLARGVALDALLRAVASVAFLRFALRQARRQAEARELLRERLGRDPTDEELFEHFMRND